VRGFKSGQDGLQEARVGRAGSGGQPQHPAWEARGRAGGQEQGGHEEPKKSLQTLVHGPKRKR
jgi:hypothetical protein